MLMIYEYTPWEGGLRYIRGRLAELEIARDNGRPRKKKSMIQTRRIQYQTETFNLRCYQVEAVSAFTHLGCHL